MFGPTLATYVGHGARIEDGIALDFGDPHAEIVAAAAGNVIAPLASFALLRFTGADAGSFLHSQLTCDVKALADARASYGGYCTAQGRLLANFLLWREADGYAMLLSRDIAAAIQRRLQMYVLRAKVQISDVSAEYAMLGLAGPDAARALGQAGMAAGSPFELRTSDGPLVIALPDNRYLAFVRPDGLAEQWAALTGAVRPVGTPCWAWLDIVHGAPWLTKATQEQFVPQMINLELLGGVSFRKGCYPGQEVVARTQYRGKTTRRMHLASVSDEPQAGAALYADALGDQACGTVVNAAQAPDGGWDLLAVLHPDATRGAIHMGAPDGATLALRELPYPIPA